MKMFSRASARGIRVALVTASLTVVLAGAAMAQSTIFNIPTTDTVDKGKGYFEFDLLPQVPGPTAGAATVIYNPPKGRR